MPDPITPFDYHALYELAASLCGDYQSADPFPHVLIEDFLSADLARELAAAVPGPLDPVGWRRIEADLPTGKAQFNKLGMANQLHMPAPIRQLILEMNSGPFIQFLEQLTGIQGLLPDPSLQGGGVHQILPGGVLGVHADFTRHRVYQLDRRINVLVYLNEDWRPEFGGHLELWSRDVERCVRRIMPSIGRCVVFSTDATSFHGHPDPVSCPPDRTRKSIALYYYTNGRLDGVEPTHRTDFRGLPDVEKPAIE